MTIRGPQVSVFAGATEVRPFQVGFPAELTSAWDASTGYSWKQLLLSGVTVAAESIPLTGDLAVTPDGDESLASGTIGWLEPDIQAGGWFFLRDPANSPANPATTTTNAVPSFTSGGGLQNTPLVVTQNTPTGGTTYTFYQTLPATTSTPAVQFVVDPNGGGAGVPAQFVIYYPNGTAGAAPAQLQVTSSLFSQLITLASRNLYTQWTSPGAGILQLQIGKPGTDQGVQLQFQVDASGNVDQVQLQVQLNGATTPVTHLWEVVGGNVQETITGALDATGATLTGFGGGGPQWVKVTKTFADFAAFAATTGAVEIYSLPARGVILAAYAAVTDAWTDGDVAEVGTAGTPGAVINGFSTTVVTSGALEGGGVMAHFDGFAVTSIKLTVTSTINLDTHVDGAIDVYLLVTTMP